MEIYSNTGIIILKKNKKKALMFDNAGYIRDMLCKLRLGRAKYDHYLGSM